MNCPSPRCPHVSLFHSSLVAAVTAAFVQSLWQTLTSRPTVTSGYFAAPGRPCRCVCQFDVLVMGFDTSLGTSSVQRSPLPFLMRSSSSTHLMPTAVRARHKGCDHPGRARSIARVLVDAGEQSVFDLFDTEGVDLVQDEQMSLSTSRVPCHETPRPPPVARWTMSAPSASASSLCLSVEHTT